MTIDKVSVVVTGLVQPCVKTQESISSSDLLELIQRIVLVLYGLSSTQAPRLLESRQ